MTILTSPSLIVELKDNNNQLAWDRFYNLYAPLIIGFAKQRGCTETVACDVLQETMVCLLRQISKFSYDPKKGQFRSYLLRIVDCRIKDAYRREKRTVNLADASMPDSALVLMQEASEPQYSDEWEQLWQQNLLAQALVRVKEKVNKRTFKSFEFYVLKGLSVAAIKDELGLKANVIYQHRNRVLKMLREEVDSLRRETGE